MEKEKEVDFNTYFEKKIQGIDNKLMLLEDFVKQENTIIKKRMDVIWKNIHDILEEAKNHRTTVDAHKPPIFTEKEVEDKNVRY